MTTPTVTLSGIVPMFNEEAVLPLLVERLCPALDSMLEPYEVVAVDDGSTDGTYAVLLGIRRIWPELRIVRFRRNSGHQAALNAGLFRSRGMYVASIGADLQDPPEKIPEMLALAQRNNLDIVYGVRNDRGTDTRFKRWTAGAYYWLMRRLVGKNVPSQGGDFRLISRATVQALKELPERAPVLRLLVPWIGFPSGQVEFVREERAQLLCLGLLGEYIGRFYTSVQNRPAYFIGSDTDDDADAVPEWVPASRGSDNLDDLVRSGIPQ